jgi:hypothetical protein
MTQPPIAARAPRPLSRAFQYFAHTGSLSGVLLLVTAAVALLWANSPLAETYFGLLEQRIDVGPAAHPLSLTVPACARARRRAASSCSTATTYRSRASARS